LVLNLRKKYEEDCSPCSYQHVQERIAIEEESLDCNDERIEESLEMSL